MFRKTRRIGWFSLSFVRIMVGSWRFLISFPKITFRAFLGAGFLKRIGVTLLTCARYFTATFIMLLTLLVTWLRSTFGKRRPALPKRRRFCITWRRLLS